MPNSTNKKSADSDSRVVPKFDPSKFRAQFPILSRKINGKPLVYLDNAATTQKPLSVIEAEADFYKKHNANVHRGIHTLSEEATALYEDTRARVAGFIGAQDAREVIFTSGTTESINLIAYTWGEQNISEGDEIAVTVLEHHSNFVPWQQLCLRKGAKLNVMDIGADADFSGDAAPKDSDFQIPDSEILRCITEKTKLVACTMASNVTGTRPPLEKIIKRAREVGAVVVLDAAQEVPHSTLNVSEIGADFVAFSAHKMMGPTGVGILWGRAPLLESMPPFLYGGEMISEVSVKDSKWNDLPWKFEAGTKNIAGIVTFAKTLAFIQRTDLEEMAKHSQKLTALTRLKLEEIPGTRFYTRTDLSMVSFNLGDVHAHDVGSILNERGVAVRAGHHCAQPLMQRLKIPACVRMSFYGYNTAEDVDIAIEAVKDVLKIF